MGFILKRRDSLESFEQFIGAAVNIMSNFFRNTTQMSKSHEFQMNRDAKVQIGHHKMTPQTILTAFLPSMPLFTSS